MWYRLSIAASAIFIIGGAAATAAELPTYEVAGFPASPAQIAVLGAAGAQERAPELAGISASPVQIAVLKRHDQKTTVRSGRSTTGLARLSTGN
ncbi:hypothetical protein [Bradyrhizobium sp.]|uniref:hypothetical protein n=1 Tax=Bradyrhizobium sp. TaxID=376 RepID=UPI001DBCDBEA|nr:hypothetical protein [Bradyrhizobium sp.]MBV8698737.1 hypothetical protein [Bradyrhizobium sp.]MBV8921288.1 hypothetical protein [Bradyrhizobium sp.]MBV9983940.1 hypothetical protein [Bradyrhizobium sp.]